MMATMEVWQSVLSKLEAGGLYHLTPQKQLVKPEAIKGLPDVAKWLQTLDLLPDEHRQPVKEVGQQLLVVLVKVQDIASRGGVTTAYIDSKQGQHLVWNTLTGFVSHPEFIDQDQHPAYWVQVGDIHRDMLLIFEAT